MQIPVLIEPVLNNGFRASGAVPFTFAVEGATRAEAIQKLKHLIAGRLKDGSELIQVDVVEQDNPWLRMAGMWDKNDPLVAEWKEIMRENRLEDDEISNTP